MLYYEKSEKEMAQKTINARISLRADTAANFASVNPVLLKNELAIEKDTGKKKLGDGSSRYSALPYLEKTNWSEIENVPSSFNPAEHAHNYAGSSSAGGAATSANKINTDAGSATQPVYFKNGIPVKTTYTLNANVPADAKFTDTIYTHPSTHAASMITGLSDVAISGSYADLTDNPKSLPADGGNADTVNGFTVEVNVPANAKFTDTTYSTGSTTVSGITKLYAGTGTNTDGTITQSAITAALNGKSDSGHTHNYAGSSSVGGAANSANKINTDAGSATQPVYFKNGIPVKTTYTLSASVPSGAKFTDTTYSTGTASAAGITKLYTSTGENTDGALTQKASNEMLATISTDLNAMDSAKADKATTLSGYGIADAYTKTEVDDALNAKVNAADLADVATSGAYADLSGTPTSLKNPTSLTLQNSAGTSLGSYDGSTARTIKLTASTVGLGNVTNESKATMFASAALTGTPTAPTAAATTNSTQIATTAFVNTVVNNKIAAADAMIYKGTIGTGGTVTALPNTHSTGWTYKVITAGTYAGVACNVGDMIICLTDGTAANNAHWTVIEGNIDGAVTGPASAVNARVAVFDGTTGKVIKDSGYTIATSVPSGAKFTDTTYSAATTSAAGLMSASDKSKLDGIASGANAYTHPSYTAKTSGLYKVTVDSTGHVSATSAVVKSDITDLGIPAQDTKYTHPSTHAASMITGLATVATSGKYSDLSGTPTIPTTLPANGGNADTVNGHTVKSNVPADAKFTDTVYTLPNATSSVLGGVKVGTNISVSNGTISVANGSTSAKGIVQLSSATNSTSTSLAATASAVKAAYDLANKKQSPSTTIAGYGITDAYTKTEINNKFSTANEFVIAVITE